MAIRSAVPDGRASIRNEINSQRFSAFPHNLKIFSEFVQTGLDTIRLSPILHPSDASLNAGVQTTWLTGKTVRLWTQEDRESGHRIRPERIRNSEPEPKPDPAGLA